MNNSKVGKDMRCFRGKPWKSDYVTLIKEYASEEYATVTQEITNTIKLMARTEGIILDPVYTGKAMAGLIDMIKNNHFKKDDNVVLYPHRRNPSIVCLSKRIGIKNPSQDKSDSYFKRTRAHRFVIKCRESSLNRR